MVEYDNLIELKKQIGDKNRIIIYGCGKRGSLLFEKMMKMNCFSIVAVADTNAEIIPPIFDGQRILRPYEIVEYDYDYVLITVEDPEKREDIIRSLNGFLIEEDRLVFLREIQDVGHDELIKFFSRNFEDEKTGRFFLFMLPEHGNVGDYAIGYAEKKFFKTYFPNVVVIEVTTSEWLTNKIFFMENIYKNDVIFFNGGGYFGDLWGDDLVFKEMVDSFPNNIKIFFPNTLTYTEEISSLNNNLLRDLEWTRTHEKLYVWFREKNSYDFYREYNNKCALCYDMALMESYINSEKSNGKVLLCFRKDREKVFQGQKILEEKLKALNIDYDLIDINSYRFVSQQSGKILLSKTIQLFQQYKCVITDRLHGMILSVTSNVPCIAYDNSTNKVKNVYKLLKEGLVYWGDDSSVDVIDIIDEICTRRNRLGMYKPPMDSYEEMANKIKKIMIYYGE